MFVESTWARSSQFADMLNCTCKDKSLWPKRLHHGRAAKFLSNPTRESDWFIVVTNRLDG